MHRNALRWLLPAALAVAALAAQAQNPARAATPPDPLDAQASVPVLVYRSSLASYRRLADDKPVPWREANETVRRIGGWRSYAREAAEPAVPAAPAASAPPMHPPGHGAHKTH